MVGTLSMLGILIAYFTIGSIIAAVWYTYDRYADISTIIALWPLILPILGLYKIVKWAIRSQSMLKVVWAVGQVIVLFTWIVTIPFRTTIKVLSNKKIKIPKATAKENNGLGR